MTDKVTHQDILRRLAITMDGETTNGSDKGQDIVFALLYKDLASECPLSFLTEGYLASAKYHLVNQIEICKSLLEEVEGELSKKEGTIASFRALNVKHMCK